MNEIEKIIAINSSLEEEKRTMLNHFQEITDLILPQRSDVTFVSQTPGRRRGVYRYDSTAPEACELLAASMAGSLTSPAYQWFELEFEDESLNKRTSVKKWLETASRTVMTWVARSNFYTEIVSAYQDLAGYGTTAVKSRERAPGVKGGFQGIVYETLPVRSFKFNEGDSGKAESFFFDVELTPKQAMDRWGKNPFFKGFSRRIADLLSSGDARAMTEKVKFLHVIMPRQDPAVQQYPAPADKQPFSSLVIEVETQHVVLESGFYESPIAVVRWSKNSDDASWGRGPGMKSLPLVKSLNKAVELSFRAWARDIDPPLVIPNKAVIGSVRTFAGGITYVRRDAKIEQLYSGGRWDVSQMNINEMREQVREMFWYSTLRPMKDSPAMTATEAQIRYELMNRLLGPTFGRLTYELFDPLVYRTFNILLRAGMIEDPPQEVFAAMSDEEGPELKIRYMSPMARAQRSQELAAIERAYALAGMVAQTTGDPTVLDNYDPDETLRVAHEVLGAPAVMLRSKDDVASLRQARAEQQQQLAEQVETAQEASVLNELASAAAKVQQAKNG